MKTTTNLIITALGLLGLASACTVETTDVSAEDVGYGEDAVCSDWEGDNATIAALATAVAKELRRWDPKADFQRNPSTWQLELTTAGKNRCNDGKICKNTQALLDLQKGIYANKIKMPNGQYFNPDAYLSRLAANYDAQLTCLNAPDNHDQSNCPVEAHDLSFVGTSAGTCATDYKFHAYKAGTTTKLQYPAQLKNRLIWAGANRGNQYLAFTVVGDDVTVDPTGGPVEGDPAASGSCAAVCSKFSITNITDKCCSCNNVAGKFQLSVPVAQGGSPYMYSCR